MSITSEQLQSFYEICKSIGGTLDLPALAENALSTYLSKLDCSAGCMLRSARDPAAGWQLHRVCSVPHDIEPTSNYRHALDTASELLRQHDGALERSDALPLIHSSQTGDNHYVFALPSFGALLLTRTIRFDHETLHEIRQLNTKLAAACKACVQHEQLSLAKKSAEAATHAKNNFLANISHEIRTPMSTIIGLTDLLIDTKLDNEQRKLTGNINEAAGDLLALVDEILDLSKIEAEHFKMRSVDFEIKNVIDRACDMVSHAIDRKKLKLTCTVDSKLKTVLRGDPGRLRQILMNLFDNAIKFTERGSITLHAQQCDENRSRVCVRFSIRDTGIGLSPQQQQSLLEPLSQSGASHDAGMEAGLGLAICKRFVEKMGGAIGIESKLGHGSTFWFTAWFTAPKERRGFSPARPAADAHRPPRWRSGMNVLLVEDNVINQRVGQKLLKRLDCQVRCADSGAEAIEAVRDMRFDLILMDCYMPEMDGFAATRAIRRNEEGKPPVPIVALTANAMEANRERCLEAGMNDFVSKPISYRVLANVLNRWSPKPFNMSLERDEPRDSGRRKPTLPDPP